MTVSFQVVAVGIPYPASSLSPPSRRPGIQGIALALATLGTLAPGRAMAGVGAGDSALFPIGLKPHRLSELLIALACLRALLNGESVTLDAGEVTIAAASTPRPPIFLAPSKRRVLALAGAIVDPRDYDGASHPDLYLAQCDIVRAAAETA